MRHHKAGRKFGRVRKVRSGLMKSLVLALVKEGKIQTTEAKAKELRPFIEKAVSTGKLATISSRRTLVSRVGSIAAEKISKEIAPKYSDRKGGYTRITKLPARLSDGALMAVIEFV